MTCQCNWARCCVPLAPTPLRLAMSQLVLKSQSRNIFQAMCCYIQISNCVVPTYMVGTRGQFSLQQQKSKVEQHCLPAPLRRRGARAKAAHGTMNINQQLGADMANSCKKYAPRMPLGRPGVISKSALGTFEIKDFLGPFLLDCTQEQKLLRAMLVPGQLIV